MAAKQEVVTVGLSDDAHKILKRLKEDRYFPEMLDAYRFAIAYAARLIDSIDDLPRVKNSTTIFNVGTLDTGGQVRVLVSGVLGAKDGEVYETAERLAEVGIRELGKRLESGNLNLSDIIDELSPPA